MANLKRHWRLIAGLFVVALLSLIVFLGRGEVSAVLATVGQADRVWLGVAILIQLAVYLNFATVYWRSLVLLGHRVKLLSLYGISFVAIFLGRVFPAGGTSTYAFLLYQLRRRGVPDGIGAVTVTLDGLSYLVAFFALLLGGFVYLFMHGELKTSQILILLILVLAVALFVRYLWAMHGDRALLTRRVLAVKNHIAKLLHRSWGDRRALAFVAELYDGTRLIKSNRWGFVQLVGLQCLALLLDSATLLFLFLALGVRPHFSVVLLGYSLAYFFTAVTSLPGGGGSFEATMTLTFTQLGVSSEVALSVTLLYRLLTFWLPLVISTVVYRLIHHHRPGPVQRRPPWLTTSGPESSGG